MNSHRIQILQGDLKASLGDPLGPPRNRTLLGPRIPTAHCNDIFKYSNLHYSEKYTGLKVKFIFLIFKREGRYEWTGAGKDW